MQEICIDEQFNNLDFTQKAPPSRDFDGCSFTGCNFNGINISSFNFIDCTFTNCNFSMVNIAGTSFKNAVFTDCKLMGVDFGKCNDLLLSFTFVRCQLDYAFFYKKKLKKTQFKECSIQEANFTESDLSLSVFQKCDLSRTTFDRTNLSGADLRSAFNYSIDPESNQIKKAKFSLEGIRGLLEKYDIEIS